MRVTSTKNKRQCNKNTRQRKKEDMTGREKEPSAEKKVREVRRHMAFCELVCDCRHFL